MSWSRVTRQVAHLAPTRLVLAWGVPLAFLGCDPVAPPEAGSSPHVLLVVVDTLRQDRLGSYGGERGLTPFLDGLASRGIRFARAYAPSSWTIPSMASLFTSRFPSQHRVNVFESVLVADEWTLAEELAGHGYQALGCSANPVLLPSLGWDQGFDAWHTWAHQIDLEVGLTVKTRGPELREDCLSRLSGLDARAPLFLYVHFMEPHTPYLPPEPYRSRFASAVPGGLVPAGLNRKLGAHENGALDLTPRQNRLLQALYDGEVAAADAALAGLFADLEGRGLLANAIVIVTSDHGEEFLEHGRVQHGFTLYEHVLRIPLIVQLPGGPQGLVVEDSVSLLDLAPTLLEWLGLPPQPRFEGRSRAARVRSEPGPPDDVVAELPGSPELRVHAAALLRHPLKLLVGPGGTELYDLERDPSERRRAEAPLAAETLRAALESRRAQLATRANPEAVVELLDAGRAEHLRALGYVVD